MMSIAVVLQQDTTFMINNIQIKNTMKVTKKLNGMPVKCVTLNSVGTYSSGGSLIQIPVPIQGTGTDQRTGDEIKIEHIEFSSIAYAADAVNFIRTIVVQFHGVTPALSLGTILQNGATGTPDVTSLYVPFYEGKLFRTLYDKVTTLCTNASNSGVADRQVLTPKIPQISMIPATNNCVDGQLAILIVSDSAVVAHPTYDYTIRTWFRDI